MTTGRSENEIVYVEVSRLRIHPTAQRDGLRPAKVEKFEREMDLDALGTFHAVRYSINGETALWVIDGHHRVEALLRAGMGEWMVRVEVHTTVSTDARSSDLFLKLNDRSAATPFERFRNELQARRLDAVAIQSLVNRNGLEIVPRAGDGRVTCIVTLQTVYALDGGQSLDAALSLIKSAWGPTAEALEGKIIEGIGRMFAKHGGSIDVPSLRKKLNKFPGGPSGLLGRARGLNTTYGRPIFRCVMDIVVELHDRGRSSGAIGSKA